MNPTLTKTYEADAAIAPRRIVKIGAGDGRVAQASASTDALIGVADSLGADGAADRCDVYLDGLVEVELGGNVTRGDAITADADGKGVAATLHTHTENTAAAYTQDATTGAAASTRIIGVAMVSGAAGDHALVRLAPQYA